MKDNVSPLKTGAIRFIVLALATTVLLVAIHLAAAAVTIGRSTAKSAGACRNVASRVALGQNMHGRKLLLVGGSGVRAGLSAEMMAGALGMNVLNFGLLAAMGPGLILDKARKVLQPGDSVILLLEYKQLVHDRWNPVSVDIAMACGKDYLIASGPLSFMEALFAAGPQRLFETYSGNARTMAKPGAQRNAFGDRLADSFPALSSNKTARVDHYQPVPIDVDPASRGARAIAAFARWAEARKIAVYASWPNTIDHDVYRRSPGFDAIERFYQSVGIHLIDIPNKGLYPRTMFYDTQYHLTYEAIRQRTQDFLSALKGAEIGFGEKVARVPVSLP